MNYTICTIFGGGGFIGKYLIRHLSSKNYRCVIPTRKPFQKGYLKTQATPGSIELIDFNPGNFSAIENAIRNSDFVINLVGILFENRRQKFNSIHVDIPEMITKICAKSGVKKYIHISAIGANKDSKSKYQRTKYLGEDISLKNFKNTVVLRPSLVVGPEDGSTNLFAKLSILPIIPLVNKKYKFQPIFVNDVAKSILKSIEIKKNEGKIYELGGPKIISFEDLVKSVCENIGKKRFIINMPSKIAKIQSQILNLLPMDPLLTVDQCEILTESDNIVSTNFLKIQDLNVTPIDIEKKMSEWLVRYRPGGQFFKNK